MIPLLKRKGAKKETLSKGGREVEGAGGELTCPFPGWVLPTQDPPFFGVARESVAKTGLNAFENERRAFQQEGIRQH